MQRKVALMLAVCFFVAPLTGCSLFGWGKKPDAQVQDSGYAADPGAGGTDAYAPAPDSGYSAPAGGKRTHTVGKKETLYAIARMYYNDQGRWKDIYEANRSSISDPNRIRVGQQLVIP